MRTRQGGGAKVIYDIMMKCKDNIIGLKRFILPPPQNHHSSLLALRGRLNEEDLNKE